MHVTSRKQTYCCQILINQQKTMIVYLSLITKKTQFFFFPKNHTLGFIRSIGFNTSNEMTLILSIFLKVFVFALASFVPWFDVSILFQSFEIWIEMVGIFAHFIDQRLLVIRNVIPILLKERFEVR